MKSVLSVAGLALALLATPACQFTDKGNHFEGLGDLNGKQFTHYNQYNVGLNLFWVVPFMGRGTIDETGQDLASAAKKDGAKTLRIVQSSSSTLWWVAPPFSFIITPVTANVAGDGIQ